MRILLDENIPKRLRFDIFITLDKNLQYQQNLKRFSIRIIILDTIDSRYQTLQPLIEKVTQSLLDKYQEQVMIITL